MPARPSRQDLIRVALTLAISAIGGFFAQRLGMPAGWVAGGLIAVALASLCGVNTLFPQPWNPPVFLVLGLYAGTGVTHETLRQMQTWPASFAILGLSLIGVVAGAYWWLNRRCGWARNDALLASLPGALSFVVAAAEGLKADLKKVAIAQSIRLIILIEAIPLIALLIGHPSPSPLLVTREVAGPLDLIILLAAGIAAGLVMNRLKRLADG